MTSREIACALITRESPAGIEILLHQRPTTNTVMPGLWELPTVEPANTSRNAPILTVRHAIMQVNYTVHVHGLTGEQLSSSAGNRRWVTALHASHMALTGLARKVLTKARLIPTRGRHAIAPPAILKVL